MNVYTNILGPQKMNPNEFSDPLTFTLAPSTGQGFLLSCEIPRDLQDRLAQNLEQTSLVIHFSSSCEDVIMLNITY